MLPSIALEVVSNGAPEGLRQQSHPVPSSLAVPHQDLATFEIDVLDPEPGALEDAEPRAIEQ